MHLFCSVSFLFIPSYVWINGRRFFAQVAGAASHWIALSSIGLHLLLTCSAYDGWPHDGLCPTYNPSTGLQERASIAGLLRAKIRTSDPLIYHRCATDGGNPFMGKWGVIPRFIWPFRGVLPNEQEVPQAHSATAATVLAYSCFTAVALLALGLVLWIPRAPGPKPPPLPLLFLRQQRERRSRALPTATLGEDGSGSSGDENEEYDEFGGQRRRAGRRRRRGQGSERNEDGTMAVQEPTFRSLGARVNAYIPLTDRGFHGLLQPRDLKPLQPPSAPALRLHTVSDSAFAYLR